MKPQNTQKAQKEDFPLKEESYAVLGAVFEVYPPYQPDFICFDKIILELKAVTQLAPEHRAQLHNYLKATGLPVGYLVNFGHFPKVEFERVVRTRS